MNILANVCPLSTNSMLTGVRGVTGRDGIERGELIQNGAMVVSRFGLRSVGEQVGCSSPKLGALCRLMGENRLGVKGVLRYGEVRGWCSLRPGVSGGMLDMDCRLLSNTSKRTWGISTVGSSIPKVRVLWACRVDIVLRSVTCHKTSKFFVTEIWNEDSSLEEYSIPSWVLLPID